MSYIEGLTPKRLSIPLEYGSLMHLCLEHLEKHPNKTPEQIARQITSNYREMRTGNLLSSHDRDSLDHIILLTDITFPEYCKYWQEDDAQIEWVKREEKFSVNYNLPVPHGPAVNIRLRGMRDAVIRVDNRLGIFETKTKSQINTDDIRDGLKADMQTMFYIFATYLQYDEIPETVLYNVIRRSSMYCRKDESIISYGDRLREDMQRRPDHYFMRWESVVTKTDVLNFIQRTLNPILVQFVNWSNSIKKKEDRFQSPYHFLNSNALFGKYGRSDMWEAIHGNYRPYRIRSSVFPELEESFLDS